METIVYRVTNQLNGKFYIGVHNNTDPDYLGSGVLIKAAVKKYGRQHFTRETLSTHRTSQQAYDEETKLLENLLDNPRCYNQCKGGRPAPIVSLFIAQPKPKTRNDKTECRFCKKPLAVNNKNQHTKRWCNLYQTYGNHLNKGSRVNCIHCNSNVALVNIPNHYITKKCKNSRIDHKI